MPFATTSITGWGTTQLMAQLCIENYRTHPILSPKPLVHDLPLQQGTSISVCIFVRILGSSNASGEKLDLTKSATDLGGVEQKVP